MQVFGGHAGTWTGKGNRARLRDRDKPALVDVWRKKETQRAWRALGQLRGLDFQEVTQTGLLGRLWQWLRSRLTRKKGRVVKG